MSVFTGRFGRWAKALLGGALVVSAVSVTSTSSRATVIDTRVTQFGTNANNALPPAQLVNDLDFLSNGKMLATTGGGLVRLNADGSKDSTYPLNFDAQSGYSTNVYDAAIDASGNTYVSLGVRVSKYLADGTLDQAFENTTGSVYFSSPGIEDLAVLPNGDLLLAGGFDSSNQFGSAGLVKIDATGAGVSAFNANVGAYLEDTSLGFAVVSQTLELFVDSQGRVVLAGLPFHSKKTPITRFNANGTPDAAFNNALAAWLESPTGQFTGVDVEEIPGGGYLAVVDLGGAITPQVDFSPQQDGSSCTATGGVFKINNDGTSDVSFNGQIGQGVCGAKTVTGGSINSDYGLTAGEWVGNSRAIALDLTGDILLGGNFISGTSMTGVMRLSPTGAWESNFEEGSSNWSPWPNSGGFSRPNVLKVLPSGETVVSASSTDYSQNPPRDFRDLRMYVGNPAPVPTVTAVSPTSGTTAGGTSITITGTNFGNASAVTVGSAACTNVVVVSATSITCTTPAGTAGTASIVVTSSGQSNAANTLFTFNAATTTTTTPATTTTTPVTTAPTTTTAPATATTTTTTTPATTIPSTTAPSGPANVTSSNQASLERTPGAVTAIVNGQVVNATVETPADLPAAQVAPEDRTPAQVQSLQTAATDLMVQFNQAAGGGSTGMGAVPTPTGASIVGLLNTPVPIENTVLVEAGSQATLFAALNEDGSVTEVKPGAVIEVLGDGQVGVFASGLTPGETVELVVMSTPILLGRYPVASFGIIKTQMPLPDGIGFGDHTLVLASPTVQASLGMKVSATPITLPATGISNGSNTLQIALWLIVGGSLVAYLRRRRNILN